MKTVLIIDMPEGVKIEGVFGVRLSLYDVVGNFIDCISATSFVLKPLPKKWEGELSSLHPLSIHAQGMRDGYNMCLEELEETE